MSGDLSLSNYTGNVLVAAVQYDRAGDIYLGRDLLDRVKKLCPNANVDFTILKPSPDELAWMKRNKIYLKPWKEVVHDANEWIVITPSEIEKRIHNYSLTLLIPSHENGLPVEIVNTKALIKIRESGAGISKAGNTIMNMGLAVHENGIFFPQELFEYALEHQNDTRFERLRNLASLPKAFLKTLLNGEYSENILQEFSENNRLYTAYGNNEWTISGFIGGLIKLKANESHNITVCVLGAYLPTLKGQLAEFFRKDLFNAKFKDIEILSTDVSKAPESFGFKNKAKGDRKLRIIFTTLPINSTNNLLKSSEKETIATGDSSFLKTVALLMHPIYDLRLHKYKFIKEFLRIVKNHDISLAAHLQKTYYFGIDGDRMELLYNLSMGTEIDQVKVSGYAEQMFSFFCNPDIEAHWKKIVEELSQRDFSNAIENVLKERLS